MEKASKIFIISLLIGLTYLLFHKNQEVNKIQKEGLTSICKFTLCKSTPTGKSTRAFVKYYVEGKRFRTEYGSCPENTKNKLNKYFKLNYLKDNPTEIIVDFNNEINDSIEIQYLESKLSFEHWINN